MIDIIGTRRLIIIVALAALNVFIAAVGYLYLIPQSSQSETRLRSINGEVSGIQSEINTIRQEFDNLGVQQLDFEKLKDSGFFQLQTRNEARAIFEAVQNESGVISAVVSIKPGVFDENVAAQNAKHKILASVIEVDIKAVDDTSIYRYISLIQKNFIGHLSIDVIDIKRNEEVTSQILSDIASGKNVEMIAAKLVMTWRTMIPETQVIMDQVLEQGG